MSTRSRSLAVVGFVVGVVLSALLAPQAATADDPAEPATTGSISGTLTRSDGTVPVGNVVDLWQQQADGSFSHLAYEYQGTEVHGQYTFDDLAPGTYHVYFYRDGDQVGFWYPSSPDAVGAGDVTVSAGQSTEVDATSAPGATISGRVSLKGAAAGGTDRGTSVIVYRRDRLGEYEVVPYDTSACCESGGPGGAEASDRTDGTYVLTALQPGSYRLYFPGFYRDESEHNDLRPIWYPSAHSLDDSTDVVVPAHGAVSGIDQAMDSNLVQVVRRPVLRGRAQVGQTLHVSTGRYTPGPIARRGYVWMAGSRYLSSVTGPSIELGPNTRGKRISVRVVAYPADAARYPTTPGRAAGPATTRLVSAAVRGR